MKVHVNNFCSIYCFEIAIKKEYRLSKLRMTVNVQFR